MKIKKGDIFQCTRSHVFNRLGEGYWHDHDYSEINSIFSKYGCVPYQLFGLQVIDTDLFVNLVFLAGDLIKYHHNEK